MADTTNALRIEQARTALLPYLMERDNFDSGTDLIADVLHWANSQGLNTLSIHATAMDHFLTEVETVAELKPLDAEAEEADRDLTDSEGETAQATLQAIQARINGEWDNPALLAFGPLSEDSNADVLAMVQKAL